MYALITITPLLELLLPQPLSFGMLCFHFCLSQQIFQFTFWLPFWSIGYSKVLCNFYVFVNFQLSSFYWFLVSFYCGWKNTWCNFYLLEFIKIFLWPKIWSTLEHILCACEKMCMLLLLDRMFGVCLLYPFGLYCSIHWFSLWLIYHCRW